MTRGPRLLMVGATACWILLGSSSVTVAASAMPPATAPMTVNPSSGFTSGVSSADPEAAVAQWDAAADANGAVGEFRDAVTGDMVAVMPGGPAATASAQVLGLAGSLGIRSHVVTATITKNRVDKIIKALVGLSPTIPAQDSYVVSFDPSVQLVTLDSSAPMSAFSSVLSEYGTSIRFTTGGPVPQSRTSDSTPHWGGAAIEGAGAPGFTDFCTSGFALKNTTTGAIVMTTAGHCFAANASVKNYKIVNGSLQGSGNSFGTDFYRSLDGDFSMMSGSTYGGWIYNSETAAIGVSGAANPSVGNSYCVSGVYSGNNCGHTLVSTQTWWCSDYVNQGTPVCLNVDDYTGGTPTKEGDSGSPWYFLSGGRASIRGSHVGAYGTCPGSGCHLVATPWSIIAGTYYNGYYAIVTGGS